jgi:hypothetical protein
MGSDAKLGSLAQKICISRIAPDRGGSRRIIGKDLTQLRSSRREAFLAFFLSIATFLSNGV